MGTQYIYITQLLTGLTQYVFLPYFAIWLFQEELFPISQAALVVSLYVAAIRLSSLLIARWVRQHEKRNIVRFSLMMISCAYVAMFFLAKIQITVLLVWICTVILLGVALSANNLALSSLVSLNLPKQKLTAGFSYINIALNTGAGVGPLVGALAIAHIPDYFPLVAIGFAIIAFILAIKLPKDSPHKFKSQDMQISKDFSTANRHYLYLLIISFLTFIGYAQFYDIFPIFAKQFMDKMWIGVFFFISSIVIVVFQIPIKNVITKISNNTTIIIAHILFAVGVIGLATVKLKLFLLAIMGVIFISAAELFYTPIYRTLAVRLYHHDKPVTGLAIQSFTFGAAESLATFLGLNLVGHGLGIYSYILGTAATLLVAILIFLRGFNRTLQIS